MYEKASMNSCHSLLRHFTCLNQVVTLSVDVFISSLVNYHWKEPDPELIWHKELSAAQFPYVKDHQCPFFDDDVYCFNWTRSVYEGNGWLIFGGFFFWTLKGTLNLLNHPWEMEEYEERKGLMGETQEQRQNDRERQKRRQIEISRETDRQTDRQWNVI